MDMITNFIYSNLEILEITTFVLVLILLLSFIAKQVVILMLLGIVAFNGYYFSMMSEKGKLNTRAYIQNIFNLKNDYVTKSNVFDLLAPNTKKILEEKNIKDINQLNDYLSKSFTNQATGNKTLNVKDELKLFEQEQLLRKTKEKQ